MGEKEIVYDDPYDFYSNPIPPTEKEAVAAIQWAESHPTPDWQEKVKTSEKPWIAGPAHKDLTISQYAARFLASGKDARSFRKSVNKWESYLDAEQRRVELGLNSAGVGLDTLAETFRAIGVPVEKAFLITERAGRGALTMLTGDEWSSDRGQTFRYNNSGLFRPIGTFKKGVEDSFFGGDLLEKTYPEIFKDGPLKAVPLPVRAMTPSISIYPWIRGAVFAWKQGQEDYPWARQNAEEFRNGLLDLVNPMWLQTPIVGAFLGMKESSHLKAIVPVVERMIASEKIGDMRQIANTLYGADLSPSLLYGIREAAREGATAKSISQTLYNLGHRSPSAGKAFQDLDFSIVPKFFKRGGEAVSSHIRDLSYEMMKGLERSNAVLRETLTGISEGGGTKVNEALYLLKSVPRNAPTQAVNGVWDTGPVTDSFSVNYFEMLRTGKVKPVSPEGLALAKEALHNTTLGYQTETKLASGEVVRIPWNPFLAPSKEFAAGKNVLEFEPSAEALNKPWVNPARAPAETISPERFRLWQARYRTHEALVDDANGIITKANEYGQNIDEAIAAAEFRIRAAQRLQAGGKLPLADKDALLASKENLSAAQKELGITGSRYRFAAKEQLGSSVEEVQAIRKELAAVEEQLIQRAQATIRRLDTPVPGITKAEQGWSTDRLRQHITGEVPGLQEPRRDILTKEYIRRLKIENLKETGDWDIAKEMSPADWAKPDGIEYARALEQRVYGEGNIYKIRDGLQKTLGMAKQDASVRVLSVHGEWASELAQARGKVSAAATSYGQQAQAFDKVFSLHRRIDTLGVERLAAGGEAAINEAMVELGNLKAQREGVDALVKNFKSFTSTPDYLSEAVAEGSKLAERSPNIAAALRTAIRAFDSGLGTIRRFQLWNPGTQITNIIDTNIVKNQIFGGVVKGSDILNDIRAGVPSARYTLLGESIPDLVNTDVAALVYDASKPAPSAGSLRRGYQTMEDAVSEAIATGENIGRSNFAGSIYQRIAGALVDQGFGVVAADSVARTEMMRFVDLVHVNYANLSPFEKLARRAMFLYPRFNINDFVNYAKLAFTHGSETVALAQLDEQRQRHSLDGKGAVQIGAMIGDPLRSSSLFKTMYSAAAIGKALTDETKLPMAALKIASAVYGSPNPLFDSLTQSAGLAPAKDKGALTKYDSLVANAAKYFGEKAGLDINFAPSDIVLEPLGFNPEEARKKSWNMASLLEQAVAMREGKILEPKQARQAAVINGMTRSALSIIAPVSLLDMAFGEGLTESTAKAEVMKLIRDGNREIDAAPDWQKEMAKESLLSRPEYKGLKPFLRKTPDEAFSQQSRDAAESVLPSAVKAGSRSRLYDSLDGPVQNIDHLIYGPSDQAGAGQIATPQAGQEGGIREPPFLSHAKQSGSFDRLAQAETITARMGTNNNVQIDLPGIEDSRNISAVLNYMLRPAIQSLRSPEAITAAIDNIGGGDRLVKAAAGVDAEFWYPVHQAYLATKSGGAEGNYAQVVRGPIGPTLNSLTDWYREKIESSGPNADAVANWDLDQFKAGLSADISNGKGPVGVSFARLDKDIAEVATALNLNLIKQRIDPDKSIHIADSNHKKQVDIKYPEAKYWEQYVKSVTRPEVLSRYGGENAAQTVFDEVQQAKEKGVVPPDFWPQFKKNNPFDYQKLGIAMELPGILATRADIFLKDERGQPFIVDPMRIANAIQRGDSASIAALRFVGDERTKFLLEEYNDKTGGSLDRIVPASKYYVGTAYGQVLDYRTGIAPIPFDLLQAPPLLQAPQGTPQPIYTPQQVNVAQDVFPISKEPLWTPGAHTGPMQPMRAGPYRSIAELSGDVLRGTYTSTYRPVVRSFDGGFIRGEAQPTFTTQQAVGTMNALATLANTGNQLAGGNQTVSAALAGFSTGLSTSLALGALGVGAGAKAGALMGASVGGSVGLAVGAAVGAAAGYMASRKKKDGSFQEREDMRRHNERLQAERDKLYEASRQAQDIQRREQSLAQTFRSGQFKASPALQDRLAQFRVRPTYASRIGLIDAVERELSSALKPKF